MCCESGNCIIFASHTSGRGWLGSRVVSVLDSGAEGPWVQIAVATLSGNSLRQLFTPIVPLFTKQQNW